jgi:hypothetical protein
MHYTRVECRADLLHRLESFYIVIACPVRPIDEFSEFLAERFDLPNGGRAP